MAWMARTPRTGAAGRPAALRHARRRVRVRRRIAPFVGVAWSGSHAADEAVEWLAPSRAPSYGVVGGEGATGGADAFETVVTPTDPTADNTVTLANASGTVMLSSLSTNAPDAANAAIV